MGFLTLEKLSKVYGDFAAARDIDLSVAEGEFVVAARALRLRQDHDLAAWSPGFIQPTAGKITHRRARRHRRALNSAIAASSSSPTRSSRI
jgi:ABC-type polar amino acid transport system ATPase subunit